jgi:lauroyl/myristoyl acyltransferase
MGPLARTPEHHELLARRHLIEDAVREALVVHVRAFPRAPRRGRGALEAAVASSRGVLVSYCHYGAFSWLARSCTAVADPVSAVVGSWVLEAPAPDERGLRIARWRRGFADSGIAVLDANGCYREVAERLRRGGLVTLAFDLPGPEPGRLLGLPVSLTTGTSRLAFETGAVVFPAARVRSRHRIRTDLGPPVDPRLFGSWQELQRELTAAHDALMGARPWAHETPVRAMVQRGAAATVPAEV